MKGEGIFLGSLRAERKPKARPVAAVYDSFSPAGKADAHAWRILTRPIGIDLI